MRAYMQPKWIAPTAVAALFAIAYVIIEPPSLDLAAHLLRAKLFSGNTAAAGWEYVQGLRLPENAARVGAEAVQLLTAPVAASGTADIVIGPAQLALQIHESTGHALELDRILGDEANFAGPVVRRA